MKISIQGPQAAQSLLSFDMFRVLQCQRRVQVSEETECEVIEATNTSELAHDALVCLNRAALASGFWKVALVIMTALCTLVVSFDHRAADTMEALGK